MEGAGNVFPEDPRSTETIRQADEVHEEAGALAIQALTTSSHAEVLAGRAPGHEVNGRRICDMPQVLHLGDAREVSAEHGAAPRLYLNLPGAAHAGPVEGQIQRAATGAG